MSRQNDDEEENQRSATDGSQEEAIDWRLNNLITDEERDELIGNTKGDKRRGSNRETAIEPESSPEADRKEEQMGAAEAENTDASEVSESTDEEDKPLATPSRIAPQEAQVGTSEEEFSHYSQDIEGLCISKAREFRLLGYEQVSGKDIWECVSESYYKKGFPPLHRIVNDIMSMRVTKLMNWMTLNVYKGKEI